MVRQCGYIITDANLTISSITLRRGSHSACVVQCSIKDDFEFVTQHATFDFRRIQTSAVFIDELHIFVYVSPNVPSFWSKSVR